MSIGEMEILWRVEHYLERGIEKETGARCKVRAEKNGIQEIRVMKSADRVARTLAKEAGGEAFERLKTAAEKRRTAEAAYLKMEKALKKSAPELFEAEFAAASFASPLPLLELAVILGGAIAAGFAAWRLWH